MIRTGQSYLPERNKLGRPKDPIPRSFPVCLAAMSGLLQTDGGDGSDQFKFRIAKFHPYLSGCSRPYGPGMEELATDFTSDTVCLSFSLLDHHILPPLTITLAKSGWSA
jgi:hypothetical protein